MARRHYRKRAIKLKLKNETIYTIFALGLFFSALFLLLSYANDNETFLMLRSYLNNYFGWMGILFPFVLIFFGFLFSRMRIFLAKPNVSIGFLMIFLSLISLTKAGVVGNSFYFVLGESIPAIGVNIIFIAGFFIGIIVFFDTSLDEIISFISFIYKNIHRIFPSQILSFFKHKKTIIIKGKQMMIKDGGKQINNLGTSNINPKIIKKELIILPDKLVSNALVGNEIWEYPPLNLLSDVPDKKADRGDVNKIAAIIEKTLTSFGITARVVEVNLGPAVTQYALEVALGTKVSKITSLSNDLALATEAPTGQIRIEAPIPGRNLVGIEIPNRSLEIVSLKTMLSSSVMQKNKSKLIVSLGLDVSGNPLVADIAKMPHVLIAGTTGSGKSVLINSFISSLLFRASPAEIKLILIDPKRVELIGYNGIPHLLTPVIVEPEKILSALKWALGEMDNRYKIFAEQGVRNIESYNELSGFQVLPYIVIIIDELAALMAFASVEVEDSIARLAQMARATGIHLVIATQRPSVDVLTGLIKANVPCRIAFNVSSMIDSRVIIDMPGAEKLLGRGDMLYIPPDQAKPTRIQGAFVSEKEVKKLVDYLKTKVPEVEYTDEVVNQRVGARTGIGKTSVGADGHDQLFEDAIRIVCQFDKASASFLQRKLSIGYSRAARIIDQLEETGIIGHAEGAKPRDVLIRNTEEAIAQINSTNEA